MSAADDIRLLQLDAIAESADLVALYACGAIDCALDGDVAELACALRCVVASVNATLATWREMRNEPERIASARSPGSLALAYDWPITGPHSRKCVSRSPARTRLSPRRSRTFLQPIWQDGQSRLGSGMCKA